MTRIEYIVAFHKSIIDTASEAIPKGLDYKITMIQEGRYTYKIMIIHKLSIVKNLCFSFRNPLSKGFVASYIDGGVPLSFVELLQIRKMISAEQVREEVYFDALTSMILSNIYFPMGYQKNDVYILDSSVSGIGRFNVDDIPLFKIRELEKIHARNSG